MMARYDLLLAAAVAVAALSPAARAQTSFTEFALSDATLNSGDGSDFWVASAAAADADLDGDLDLLVAGYYVVYNEYAEDRLTLYRNDGPDGSVWQLTPLHLDSDGLSFGNTALAWADYDLDGDPDLLVGTDGATALYRNDGGELVRTPTELPAYHEFAHDYSTYDQRSLAWGDVDNDGDPDLLFPSIRHPSGFGFEPVAILRNDGPGESDGWAFTHVAALDTAWNAVGRWGDMDADGDLDVLLGNVSAVGGADGSFLHTYRNDGGALVAEDTGLPGLRYGMADWGDADGDGDLDVLVAGLVEGGDVVAVLHRTPAGYVPDTLLTADWESDWLNFNAASWADYDGDGDVDVLIAGEVFGDADIEGRAQVYVNDGAGAFSPGVAVVAPALAFRGGAFTWFDVDSDGDLDLFLAGAYGSSTGGLLEARTQLYRNDAVTANAAPAAPDALTVSALADGAALRWAAATDDTTPRAGLTYTLEVVPVGADEAVGAALPAPGNVGASTGWAVRGMEEGTYRARVRAVDAAFAAGPVAEATFTVGVTGVESGTGAAAALLAPYPSPAVGSVTVPLALAATQAEVRVELFDVLGRRVAVLYSGALPAGQHAIEVDTSRLAGGVYVVRLQAGGFAAERRLTVVR